MTLNPSAAARSWKPARRRRRRIHSATSGSRVPEGRRSARSRSTVPISRRRIADGQHLPRRALTDPKRADHGAAVHDLRQRRIDKIRRRRAPERLGRAQRNDGPVDGDVRRKPRTAVQQREAEVQRRRARADRQPARVRLGDDRRRASSPYTGTAAQSPSSSFTVDSNGTGGACASPLPFSLSQETSQTSLPGTPAQKPPTRSTSSGRRPAVPVADQDRLCRRASSGCCRRCRSAPNRRRTKANARPRARSAWSGLRRARGRRHIGFNGHVYLTGPTAARRSGSRSCVPASRRAVQPRQRASRRGHDATSTRTPRA